MQTQEFQASLYVQLMNEFKMKTKKSKNNFMNEIVKEKNCKFLNERVKTTRQRR